jgi:hypothetical protein
MNGFSVGINKLVREEKGALYLIGFDSGSSKECWSPSDVRRFSSPIGAITEYFLFCGGNYERIQDVANLVLRNFPKTLEADKSFEAVEKLASLDYWSAKNYVERAREVKEISRNYQKSLKVMEDYNQKPLERTIYINAETGQPVKVIKTEKDGPFRWYGPQDRFDANQQVPELTKDLAAKLVKIENPRELRDFLSDVNLFQLLPDRDLTPFNYKGFDSKNTLPVPSTQRWPSPNN